MDANREQQLKRIDAIAQGAAAEADTIREQQLCTKCCPAPDYSRRQTRGKYSVTEQESFGNVSDFIIKPSCHVI